MCMHAYKVHMPGFAHSYMITVVIGNYHINSNSLPQLCLDCHREVRGTLHMTPECVRSPGSCLAGCPQGNHRAEQELVTHLHKLGGRQTLCNIRVASSTTNSFVHLLLTRRLARTRCSASFLPPSLAYACAQWISQPAEPQDRECESCSQLVTQKERNQSKPTEPQF